MRREAAKLKADGVDIIIVLSHSGLDVDIEIAANCGPNVDVIVGGHSHTFLYTGSYAPGPDTPRGDYPTVVTQDDGHKVYVVQASAYTKYLGDITFYFDEAGEILSYEGAPHYLDESVVPGKLYLAHAYIHVAINHHHLKHEGPIDKWKLSPDWPINHNRKHTRRPQTSSVYVPGFIKVLG